MNHFIKTWVADDSSKFNTLWFPFPGGAGHCYDILSCMRARCLRPSVSLLLFAYNEAEVQTVRFIYPKFVDLLKHFCFGSHHSSLLSYFRVFWLPSSHPLKHFSFFWFPVLVPVFTPIHFGCFWAYIVRTSHSWADGVVNSIRARPSLKHSYVVRWTRFNMCFYSVGLYWDPN